MTVETRKSLQVVISGRVQGVGFRFWTADAAEARGLTGWVRNLTDGRVEAMFSGPAEAVEDMLVACRKGPRSARVSDLQVSEVETPSDLAGFEIRF